jgi:polyhydroxybutyrate depolymerase
VLVAVVVASALLSALTACRSLRGSTDPPAGAGIGLEAGRSDHTITTGSRQRTYHLYVPAGLSGPAPLVVMLHGGFGDGIGAENYYGWDAQAEQAHFVVVYPDGVDRAWAVGGGCCGVPGSSGVDDVAFIKAVVADVSRQVSVDAKRVFATGISNGGLLAYRLACDTTLFRAIGPDSATLLGTCPSPARLSVIHIHGTADNKIPYEGGPGSGVAKIDGPAVPDVVESWRAVDGCAPPTESTVGTVTMSLAACADGRAVELITIAGAGHQWPGSPSRPAIQKLLGLDPPATAVNATAVIWQFFATH